MNYDIAVIDKFFQVGVSGVILGNSVNEAKGFTDKAREISKNPQTSDTKNILTLWDVIVILPSDYKIPDFFEPYSRKTMQSHYNIYDYRNS